MNTKIASVILLAGVLAACSQEKGDHKRPALRAALDQSTVTLQQSVDLSVAQTTSGKAFEGALVIEGSAPMFAVGTVEVTTLKEFRINGVSGTVVSNTPISGTAPGACPGQIPINQALDIAAAEANGDAIAVVPDDDVECAFEIQVLSGETLWEVKLAQDGAVLEHELSDEYSGNGS